MIYLLYGENYKASREKLRSITVSLLEKDPNSSLFKLTPENFNEGLLEEYIKSQTLFAGKYIVVLDSLFENKEYEKLVLNNLKDISASPNIFIFIEETLSNSTLSRFKKWAEKIQKFSPKEGLTKSNKVRDGFNIYALTDSFAERRKKDTWVLYQKALRSGVTPDEVLNVILWQVKNLLIVKNEPNLSDLKLNPFVLRKSLGFCQKFEFEELAKISESLLDISHRVRRGEGDVEILLEEFILSA